jgi:hypothetical protein
MYLTVYESDDVTGVARQSVGMAFSDLVNTSQTIELEHLPTDTWKQVRTSFLFRQATNSHQSAVPTANRP